MPYQGVPDGLYLARRHSPTKGVDHYGILDIGNRLRRPDGPWPVVVHQSPPNIQAEWLDYTGSAWTIIEKIQDEIHAEQRLVAALTKPAYHLLNNNCEHFARFVAHGRRESPQLQDAVVTASLVGLIVFASRAA